MRIALGLLAVVLMWAVVVASLYGFMLAMIWLTSRIFRLTGRRPRNTRDDT